MDQVLWRSEIDALVFPVEEHTAFCAVHRLAFRALLGSEPTPGDCLDYFGGYEYPAGRNFHLTSRDIARKLLELKPKEQGEA